MQSQSDTPAFQTFPAFRCSSQMMYPFDFMFERTLTFALFEMTRIPVMGSRPKTIRRLSLFTIWVRIREEIRCFSSLLRFSPSAAAMRPTLILVMPRAFPISEKEHS